MLLRGQVTGKIADYEQALRLADEVTKQHPKDATLWGVHAQVMTTFHRFDDALADYKRSEKLGMKPIELVAPREDIAATRGNDTEALAYREKLAKERPGIDTLGALAVTVGDTGDLRRASKLFGDAQDSYRNISPFPVAMLYFQNGLLEQKLGSATRARVLFQAAHDRLPCYPQATAHLASVLEATGQRDQAIELLRGAIKTSDDPEFVGQLAATLKAAGQNDEAASLHKRAADRYEELVKKYPLAFADHAARFWLLPDGDAKRALALAQMNAKNRPTAEALRLVLDAAMAANDNALACKTGEALLARPFVTAPSRVGASKAFMACGQKERGEKELASAMKSDSQPIAAKTPTPAPKTKPDTRTE
jgi:tetratricopeptide (TPR) repeat protein